MAYRLSRSNTSSPTSNTTATSGRKTANRPRKPRFSRRKYAALLSETLPRVIATPEELERLARQIEPLLDKGERRTPEEEALCCLSLKLIDDYQQAHRSIPEMKPHELLQALLEESGKRQADLLSVFGSRSRVSDAVNGKRAISKSQAKRLGEFFSVTPAAFI
ncbi:MAG: transcriptional regulator [Acidobacteriota bacterium]